MARLESVSSRIFLTTILTQTGTFVSGWPPRLNINCVRMFCRTALDRVKEARHRRNRIATGKEREKNPAPSCIAVASAYAVPWPPPRASGYFTIRVRLITSQRLPSNKGLLSQTPFADGKPALDTFVLKEAALVLQKSCYQFSWLFYLLLFFLFANYTPRR